MDEFKITVETEGKRVRTLMTKGEQKRIFHHEFFTLMCGDSRLKQFDIFSNAKVEGIMIFAISAGILQAKKIAYEEGFDGKFPEEYEKICSGIIDAERAGTKFVEAVKSLKSKKYSSNNLYAKE
jgi:hypothetical protein